MRSLIEVGAPAMEKQSQFCIDGRMVTAQSGMNLAAAIMNAGIAGMRAAPDGEPRGPWCGMGVCFECRVTVDGRRDVRACMTQVWDGMEVRTLGA